MFCVLGDDLGDSTLGPGLGLCMCHLDTTSGCKLSTTGFLCPQVSIRYIGGAMHQNLRFMNYIS